MNTKLTTMVDENGRECSKCKVYKTWDFFYKAKGQMTGHMSCCKNCSAKTIEVSRFRKKYTYSDKTLLEIEKAHKNKEARIIGSMKKESKTIDIPKRTDRNDYTVAPNYWEKGNIVRVGENPVPFLKLYIK